MVAGRSVERCWGCREGRRVLGDPDSDLRGRLIAVNRLDLQLPHLIVEFALARA